MAEGGGCEERIQTKFSSGSDIMYDFYCELCKDDGKNVEAEGYCNDCSEYLCGECYSGHTKSRQTRHHKLLDKDSMPKDKPLPFDRVSRSISTMCPFHSENPVKYFCKKHNFLGCEKCLFSSHMNCHDSESVLEKSEGMLVSNEYKELLQHLQDLGKRSSDMAGIACDNIKEIKANYLHLMASINAIKKQVIENLERIEKDIASKAAKLVSAEEQKMNDLFANCKYISGSVDSLLANFQSLQSSKRVCDIYISMKQNNERIRKFQDDLRVFENSLAVRKFMFKPNTLFQEVVIEKSLGNIYEENPESRMRLRGQQQGKGGFVFMKKC